MFPFLVESLWEKGDWWVIHGLALQTILTSGGAYPCPTITLGRFHSYTCSLGHCGDVDIESEPSINFIRQLHAI